MVVRKWYDKGLLGEDPICSLETEDLLKARRLYQDCAYMIKPKGKRGAGVVGKPNITKIANELGLNKETIRRWNELTTAKPASEKPRYLVWIFRRFFLKPSGELALSRQASSTF